MYYLHYYMLVSTSLTSPFIYLLYILMSFFL
jgi:hypothetical protein